jgi:hypothetical protein
MNRESIKSLQVEAGAAGDTELVATCFRALHGDAAAIETCARVVEVMRKLGGPRIPWRDADDDEPAWAPRHVAIVERLRALEIPDGDEAVDLLTEGLACLFALERRGSKQASEALAMLGASR